MQPNEKELKDSGSRQEYETGARRDNPGGKGRFDLLPTHAIFRIANTLEKGAKKYGDRNWEVGIPVNRYIDAALRHTMQYLEGYRDEDHLSQAAWNLLCAIETEFRVRAGRLPDSLLEGMPPELDHAITPWSYKIERETCDADRDS